MAKCVKSAALTPAALLVGMGGGLGFLVVGFFYPWLWLGVPGCLCLGLLLGLLKKSLPFSCR